MADHATTTNLSRWDAAFVDYKIAKAASDAVAEKPASRVRDHVNDMLDAARQAIFALAAARLGSVAEKLMVYWGDQLFQDDWYGVGWRRMCVGDLRRIEMQIAGIEEPDASGGMDMEKVARDWTDAFHQLDHWDQLLAEGPSDRWGESTQSDILALKDEAEGALLSLPAPDLLAVIKKLETLWMDQRFDVVDDTSGHLLIMRDLRRFALKYQQ